MARRLRLVEIVYAVAPGRDQGLTVGTSMLLAVLHRVLASCSKAPWHEGFRRTALYHDFLFGRETCEASGFGTTGAT